MKLVLKFILILLIFQSCQTDNKPERQLFVEEFDWNISVPKYYEVIDPDEWNKSREFSSDDESLKTLIVFKKSKSNYFQSNYYLHEKGEKEYIEDCNFIHGLMYKSMTSQFPEVKIDTTHSTELIDNLEFYKFVVSIEYSEYHAEKYIEYYRLFEGKAFSANIKYRTKKRGLQMLEAFKNSTFGKKEDIQ